MCGGAIEAETVRRLVLPGVRARSPFEEGILHLWTGGWLSTRWIGGEGGVFVRDVGSLLGYRTAGEKLCMRVGQLSRHSQVLLLPLGVPPMPACSTHLGVGLGGGQEISSRRTNELLKDPRRRNAVVGPTA